MSQRDCRLTGTRSLERRLCRGKRKREKEREREREREREKLLCRNDFSLYSRACDVEKSLDVDAFVRVSWHRVKTKETQRNIGFVRAGRWKIGNISGSWLLYKSPGRSWRWWSAEVSRFDAPLKYFKSPHAAMKQLQQCNSRVDPRLRLLCEFIFFPRLWLINSLQLCTLKFPAKLLQSVVLTWNAACCLFRKHFQRKNSPTDVRNAIILEKKLRRSPLQAESSTSRMLIR